MPSLAPLLLILYTTSYSQGALPQMFSEAYITVLEKNPNDRASVGGYRPISLLNTDYKILAKILVNKIQPHLHTIIHPNQYCSIPGRNIETLNHNIRDIITYAHVKHIQVALLSIDQEKAFDRVAHSYLFEVLRKCNLGTQVEGWVRLLYQAPQSRLLVNQILTAPFPVQRSVRQGCPLSPLLYVLCIEPMLEMVRRDDNVHGLRIPGQEEIMKGVAYADDTTFMPTREKDISNILLHFRTFEKACGAKINLQKSAIMGLGKWRGKKTFSQSLQVKTEMKLTGILCSNNPHTYNTKQYNDILQHTDNTIHMYKHISHTIFGRSIIINTFILPKLLYISTVCEPPPNFISKIHKKTWGFYFQKHTTKHTPHYSYSNQKRRWHCITRLHI